MPSISLASYFRADHLTFHPSIPLATYFCVVHSLGELFSCQPFNSPPLVSFLCRSYNSPSVHRFGELFLCRPSLGRVIFVSTIQLSCPSIPLHGQLFLCRPSIRERYSRADPLILHPLASYFDVYHITFHPSIPLASYFCAIPPLGNLFSCQLFNSSVFSELFSCRPYISPPVHPFGELFLCCLSLGRAIFVPTI